MAATADLDAAVGKEGQGKSLSAGDGGAQKRSLAGRLTSVAGDLLKVHVELAKLEAKRDKRRLTSAVLCGVLGAGLLLMVILLLEATAVMAVHERTALPLMYSLLAVAGANAILGLLMVLIASLRLRAPIMPETRGLVQRTFATMTDV